MKNDPHDIVRRPLITEKGTDLQAKQNRFTFLVAPYANKVQIAQAVQKLFSVEVMDVRTMVRRGKTKGKGPRAFRRPDWKRAVVRLREGQTIEFL